MRSLRRLRFVIALAVVAGAALLFAAPALAATRTLSGGSAQGCPPNSGWTTTGCWTGGVVPVTGDDVVIEGGVAQSQTNYNLGAGVQLRSITVNSTNNVDTHITGGPIALQSGAFITNNWGGGGFGVHLPGVTLNGPATLTQNTGTGFVEFSGAVTGTGPLTLVNNTANDALRLAAASTYSGATTVSSTNNSVRFDVNGAVPTGSALTVNGVARFLNSSTVGSLAGGGDVALGATTLTAGGDNTSATYSGVLSGTGGLTKTGTGTLTLSGSGNSYTGATTVNAGALSVTGQIVSPVTASSGATLEGTGTVNNSVTVNSGGTLAPGLSVGTLNTGNVTFASGSSYAAELDGTGSDRLNVSGAVSLGGATLNLSLLGGYVHAPGTVYTIIANDGADPVSGTFSGLAGGATFTVGGHVFQISYAGGDGNDVTLTALASPTISTSASADVVIGGSVDDTAVFSGGFSMTGAIAFNLYGPNDSSCSGSPAFTSSGFMVPGQIEYGSGPFQPAAPGTYRWTVSYSGDSNNEAAASICNAANETVVISPAGTTLTTTASAGVVIGGSVHDTATVAGGVSPSGSITFKLYGPNDATCSGSPAFSSAVSVSGNGSYDSPTFTPTSAGTYRWTASYTGDGNNTPVAAVCNLANESVVISKASPTLSLKAIAKVASSIGATGTLGGGHSAAGQITFDLYGPGGDCSGTPIFTDTVSVSDNGAYTSKTFAPTKAGSYSWSASYSGDQNNEQALAPCTGPEASFSICVIPKVKGLPLAKAKRKITDASCATGKVTRAFSRRIEKGKILWQRWTKPGTPRPGGTLVHLVVSKGPPA